MVGNDVCGEKEVENMKKTKLPFLFQKYVNLGG